MPSQQRRIPSAEPLNKHAPGRRRGTRVSAVFQVDCQGPVDSLRGRVLNVSREGAMLSLTPRRFKAGADLDLVDVAARLQEEFPDGFTLRFLAFPITVKASIVRVARLPEDGTTVMGCKFERSLSFQACRLLGIPCADDDSE